MWLRGIVVRGIGGKKEKSQHLTRVCFRSVVCETVVTVLWIILDKISCNDLALPVRVLMTMAQHRERERSVSGRLF